MGIINPLSNQDDNITKYRNLIRAQMQILLEKNAAELNANNEIAKFTQLMVNFGDELAKSDVGIKTVQKGIKAFKRIYKNTNIFQYDLFIKEDSYSFFILLGIAMSDRKIYHFIDEKDYKVDNLEELLKKLYEAENLYNKTNKESSGIS